MTDEKPKREKWPDPEWAFTPAGRRANERDFIKSRPKIIRSSFSLKAGRPAGPRLPGLGAHRPHAGDHAALVVDLPGAEE